jgi:hypothetical protein
MISSRRAAVLLAGFGVLATPRSAGAYPWMIRHGYNGCGVCHVDPSGSGLLTAYGRAQSELSLATRFAGETADEASAASQFAFGLLTLPEWLLLGFSYRGAELWVRATNQDAAGNPLPVTHDARFVQMVADLRMGLRVSRFRASATVGWAPQQASAISLTSRSSNNVTSREHWIGWELGEDGGLIRAGRIPLPFGLRNVEHTSWVRAATATDVNQGQQAGLSLYLGDERFRGEIMLIAGNFQLSPDEYRERGYSGYIEASVGRSATVGLSSKITRAERDRSTGQPTLRQAHGGFVRWAVHPSVALLAEGDALIVTPLGTGQVQSGAAAWLQLDWEPLSGLHLAPALEALRQYGDAGTASFGQWLTLDWFVHSHVELRFDLTFRQVPPWRGSPSSVVALAQIHVLL